jgi:hypothetical protein
MSELRAIKLVASDLLWVVSGSKNASAIVAFRGAGARYHYAGTVAELAEISSLSHPFDVTLGGSGNCYVSNQDTDVVARLAVAADLLSASPAPVAPGLPSPGTFLPGTFVASSNGDLPGVAATTAVAAPAGLEVAFDHAGKVAKSVRGVVWVNGALYVADEVANAVKVYDADGHYLGASTSVPGPVHLLATEQGGTVVLYVCNGTRVLSAVLDPAHPEKVHLHPVAGIDVPKVSGLALGAKTDLYAASRDAHEPAVFKYTGFPAAPKLDRSFAVADVPEFLLHVPNASGG